VQTLRRVTTGLTLDEAATVLGISPATADRYWAYARAWLHQEIVGAGGKSDAAEEKSDGS
jgi:DNA-directed RNA polymerase specialized sigma24 family protein